MKHTVASCRVKLSIMRAIILSVLAASLVCNAVETYDPKFDNIDAQVLVDDIFLLKNYGKLKGFQTKLPEMWKDLEDKIDPTKEYRPAFAEFLKRSD
ncbi:unnamed protein product [Leptidea sinapis]|uniref:Uncharacterized protein n=1 Tax=Leptidea sinapis TaxID=189913 RepID=A0A5E4QWQ0_9NEOP|nr:unnamed protein product [Leptidea sinapis]